MSFFKTNVTKFSEEKIETISNYEKVNFFKPKSGANTIRILPPYSEAGLPYQLVLSHTMMSLRDDATGQVRTVNPVCFNFLFSNLQRARDLLGIAIEKGLVIMNDYSLYKKNNNKCPICAINEIAYRLGDNYKKSNKELSKHYKEVAYRSKPQAKYYFNIIDRSDNIVKVYNCSSAIASKVKNEFHMVFNDEKIDIFDPIKGRDAILNKIELGGKVSYEITFRRTVNPLSITPSDLYNLDEIVISGIKDYVTMLDVISSTESLSQFCQANTIKFESML